MEIDGAIYFLSVIFGVFLILIKRDSPLFIIFGIIYILLGSVGYIVKHFKKR